MSASTSTFVPVASTVDTSEIHAPETRHRNFLAWMLIIFAGGVIALVLYGQDYYRLSQPDRALSPKHHLLKPGGLVGINLGLLGVAMLCGIFLYPLRKRWRWLQRQGNTKHWLDHHVVLGIAAPVCIALHSSFKFRGLAGLAFWLMIAVSLSGLIGRYLYAQVLQDIADAESQLGDFQARTQRQRIISQCDLQRLLPVLPKPVRVSRWSPLMATIYMLGSDLSRPIRIMRLRARILGSTAAVRATLGFVRPWDGAFEEVIRLTRNQAVLSRRILLLSHAKRVFQLWHVVHKPFSYAFAILALLHIGVAMMLGFF